MWIVTIEILGAVQRYFESRRRNWRESSSEATSQDRVTKQAIKRRKRSRQQRVSYSTELLDIVVVEVLSFFTCFSSTIGVKRWYVQERRRIVFVI